MMMDEVATTPNVGEEGPGLYPPPTGPTLNEREAKDLDARFFESDPMGYFHSRIQSLLSWGGGSTVSDSPLLRSFLEKTRLEPQPGPENFDRELQLAKDSLQVRHHVAEATLRLLITVRRQSANKTPASFWLTLVETPIRVRDLLEEVDSSFFEADNLPGIGAGLLLPLSLGTPVPDGEVRGLQNSLSWIARARELLSDGHIDVNSANNRIKHGVAAMPDRTRRLSFALSPPSAAGEIRVSDVSGPDAVELFDTTFLEYVSRPAKRVGEPKHGYERTLLRTDPGVLLAEAWMMTLVYGAMFYTAVYRFGGTDVVPSRYPGLRDGPTPSQMLGDSVVGLRFPLTAPPGGGPSVRPSGMGFNNGYFVPMEFGPMERVEVIKG